MEAVINDNKMCEHFKRFEQISEEMRAHHTASVAMYGKIEVMNLLLQHLNNNTNHLKYLEVIAEQVTTMKERLLDSATNKRSVSNWTLTLLMSFMFAALFSVTALFLIERIEKQDASVMIDALKGRLEITGHNEDNGAFSLQTNGEKKTSEDISRK